MYIKDLILFRLVGGLLRPELERWVGHILQGELSSLSSVLSPLSQRSHIPEGRQDSAQWVWPVPCTLLCPCVSRASWGLGRGDDKHCWLLKFTNRIAEP